MNIGKPLAIGVGVVAVVVVVAAIVMMGSPADQRRVLIDAGRIDDLNGIESAVREHAQEHDGKLPADLVALEGPGRVLQLADRENGKPYEYAVVDPKHFRLCAHFDTDTAKRPTIQYPASVPRWAHGTGRHCFTRTLTAKDSEAVRIEDNGP